MQRASSTPRRDFPLLVGGQVVSRLGDRLALIALPWLVYSTTGSTITTGIVLALFTLPYILFGALAGAVIDRSRKRSLMIIVDIVRALLVAAVPFVAPHSLVAVYALAFLVASATVFFDPCLLAFLPEVVPKDRLLRANSILATGDNLTEIVGFAGAGILVAVLSTRTAFFLDAITFMISATAIALMSTGRRQRHHQKSAPAGYRRADPASARSIDGRPASQADLEGGTTRRDLRRAEERRADERRAEQRRSEERTQSQTGSSIEKRSDGAAGQDERSAGAAGSDEGDGWRGRANADRADADRIGAPRADERRADERRFEERRVEERRERERRANERREEERREEERRADEDRPDDHRPFRHRPAAPREVPAGGGPDRRDRHRHDRRRRDRRRHDRRRIRAVASTWVREIVRDEAWWHGMAPLGGTLPSALIDGGGAASRAPVDAESDGMSTAAPAPGDRSYRDQEVRRPNLLREMREGYDYLMSHRGLRANTLLTVAAIAGIGAAYPLTFLLAAESFDGTRAFGFMEAAIGAGYLLGSVGLVALAQRVRKGITMTVGMVIMGVGFCAIASLANLGPILAVFALVGAANAIVLIAIDTYLQEAVPAALRGRVFGLRFTVTQGVYALGVLAAGGLASTVPLDWLFLAVGLIVAIPALIGLLSPTVSEI